MTTAVPDAPTAAIPEGAKKPAAKKPEDAKKPAAKPKGEGKPKAKGDKPATVKRGVVEMVQVYKAKKEALLQRTAATAAKYDERINTLESKYAARLDAAALVKEKGGADAAKAELDAQIKALRKRRSMIAKV